MFKCLAPCVDAPSFTFVAVVVAAEGHTKGFAMARSAIDQLDRVIENCNVPYVIIHFTRSVADWKRKMPITLLKSWKSPFM